MNNITKIALSLSLIALVTQPLHATPSQEYGKRATKIAACLGIIGGGIWGLRYSVRNYNDADNKIAEWTNFSREHKPLSDDEWHIIATESGYLAGTIHPRSTDDIANRVRPRRKTVEEQAAFIRTAEQDERLKQVSKILSDDYILKYCTTRYINESTNTRYKFAGFSCASAALIACGLYGLKEELCPDFKPIEWIKNKIGMKTKQTEQAA